jgi:uncharacterized membrane protein (UPF0127 family)
MRIVYHLALSLFILLGMIPCRNAHAEGTFTYTRTNMVIMRESMQSDALPPLPWQEETASPDSPGVIFDIEIRDGQSLYSQKGWYNLSGPSEKSGVMLMFDHPGIVPIINSAQYAPLDILMVDSQGIIAQIVPNLMMAALEQEILPSSPIKAFLFLKGGACELMNIQPGDRVLYKGFKQPPTVLSAPSRPQQPVASQPVTSMKPLAPTPPESPASQPQTAVPDTKPATPVATGEAVTVQPERRRPSGALMIPVN